MKNRWVKVLIIVASIVVALVLIGAILLFLFPIYSISGKLIDSDTNKPIEGIEMSLGTVKAKTLNQGDFSLKNFGKKNPLIANLPKEYEKSETKIDYNSATKSGLLFKKIKLDVKANPTLDEKTKRVKAAVEEMQNDAKFGRSEDEYNKMHPDCQKMISKDDFIKGRKDALFSGAITDFKLGNVKFLDSWKFDKTGNEYKNVAEIEETMSVQVLGFNQSINYLAHYVNVDGKWKWFYAPEK